MIEKMLEVMDSMNACVACIQYDLMRYSSDLSVDPRRIANGVLESFNTLREKIRELDELVHDHRDSVDTGVSITGRMWRQKFEQLATTHPNARKLVSELAENLNGRNRWQLQVIAKQIGLLVQ